MKRMLPTLVAGGLATLVGAAHANLLVNGGFEASTSHTATPPGWANLGHTEGVIQYSDVPTQPVYQGQSFYDIGGVGGNGIASVGEGIAQTFATLIGTTYTATYGYTGENLPGSAIETLQVSAAGASQSYVLTPDGNGVFTHPWTTGTLSFVATSATTTLSFTLAAINGVPGNNDPMIDGVSVVATTAAVPEVQTSALMLAGLVGMAGWARRRARY